MKIVRIFLLYLLIPILVFAVFLMYSSITDFRPNEYTVQYRDSKVNPLNDTASFSIFSWNIGYAGLGKDMDFFYDGGDKVRDSEYATLKNLAAIKKRICSLDTIDFILLQEVDLKSHRSYRINMSDTFRACFPERSSFIGINYNVTYVPVPLTNPMGRVLSGLQVLSIQKPSEVTRISYPGNYSWPKSLFMLDRCFLVQRFPLSQGKELLIINTHNSAYDDGSLRIQQMEYLQKFLLKEYEKGNYIVVGGDWNQCPPGFKHAFVNEKFDELNYAEIKEGLFSIDWKWVYSNNISTNRRVDIPYIKETTSTTVIDFYLLSPNIQEIDFKVIDLGYENSDHNPVQLKFKLIH